MVRKALAAGRECEGLVVAAENATPRKVYLDGIGISATSYEEVVRIVRGWLRSRHAGPGVTTEAEGGRARYICVTCVHSFLAARSSREVREALNQADIVTPDGMPIVWALRSLGVKEQQRVYGPTLMLYLCEQAARLGHRVFLYGGRPEALPRLVKNLTHWYPSLKVVGSYSPPFRELTPEEDAAVVRQILDSGADLIFVGISSPKQDLWMYRHRAAFPGRVMIGVGAAFDFHAGRVRQAPGWMQQAGLEWLFRLLMEPRRLWKRYLLVTPRFLPLWAREWCQHMLRYRRGRNWGGGNYPGAPQRT